MSAGSHHAVSTNRFGCSGSTRHSHARSEIAAWARISRASVNSPDSRTVSCPSAGMPRPAWISTGTRRSCASATISRTAGSDSVKRSARGCSLMPLAPASRQRRASVSGSARGSTRQNATSRPPDSAAAASTRSLAGRIAVRLVHGEHDAARAGTGSSPASSSLGGLPGAVGIGVADVRVRVEQPRVAEVGAEAVPPGAQDRVDGVHRARDPIQAPPPMADTAGHALPPRARPHRDAAPRDRGHAAAAQRGLPVAHHGLPERPRARVPRRSPTPRSGGWTRAARPSATSSWPSRSGRS